jgi:hypothetical protein
MSVPRQPGCRIVAPLWPQGSNEPTARANGIVRVARQEPEEPGLLQNDLAGLMRRPFLFSSYWYMPPGTWARENVRN